MGTLSFNKGTQFSHQVQIGTRPGGEDINSEGTPIGGWTFDAAGDCYPKVQSDCQRRGRGDTTDSFWISWTGSTGYGVIPAPQPGDEQQIEGVHNNYFFNYNTSVMHGCQPYWDISQEGLVTDRAAFMKRGYAMIGIPPGENQALPSVKITVNYNCSDAATSCFGADCYTLFTGGLPLNATNCGPSSATASECATPMFRWIKTLLPVPPQAVSFVSEGANATEGVVGGVNLVWEVPQSGEGEWSNEDQKISRYFLQVQDANTYKFVKTYNLTVTPGSALSGPLGSKVFFLVDGLVDKEWYTFIITPTNNDSIVGESNQQQFQAGANSKSGNSGGPTTTTIIIIAAGAGVGLIVLGCLVYHCCISSGKKAEAPYQQLPPGPPATAPARKDFPAAQHRYNPPAAPAAPQDSYSAAINSAEAKMQ